MTAEFKELGFRFQYPENWTLQREATDEWPRSVSVHAPSGSFWMVTEHPRVSNLVEQIANSIQEEYEEVDTDSFERQLGPLKVSGKELDFFCLDCLIRAEIFECGDVSRNMVVLTQAESREQGTLSKVFDAITLSLLTSLEDSPAL